MRKWNIRSFSGGIEMKMYKCVTLVAVLLACIPCLADEPNQQTIVSGNNKFALNLYQNLKTNEGNLFLSPYSISTALAMTYAGARGETEKQMAQTLCFRPMKNEQFHKTFGEIIKQLNASGEKGGYELVVANALWGQKDYKFLPEFLTLVRENYGGYLQQVDFKTQTEEARKTINTWVENKTKDKIKELIKPEILDPLTRLVLTNAIYFKSKWENRFLPEFTQNSPFFLSGGEKVTVPIMRNTSGFKYAKTRTLQVLELPYANNSLSMVILLPKKIDGIKKLENELTSDKLAALLTEMSEQRVEIYIPKFKITSQLGLSNVLSSMGMPDAFSGNANFSGMTDSEKIFISGVIHQAYINVDEEGTEAGAATAVMLDGGVFTDKPPVFKADHPFIFLIRDNQTGSILFLGRVANPVFKDN
jgi:serpin B